MLCKIVKDHHHFQIDLFKESESHLLRNFKLRVDLRAAAYQDCLKYFWAEH
jgi:hypothetical protein